MNWKNGVRGCGQSLQTLQDLDETRLVGIADWRFAIGLDPFRVLNAQVMMDLPLQLAVAMDWGTWGNTHFLTSSLSERFPARPRIAPLKSA